MVREVGFSENERGRSIMTACVSKQSACAQVEQGFVQVGAEEHLLENDLFHRSAQVQVRVSPLRGGILTRTATHSRSPQALRHAQDKLRERECGAHLHLAHTCPGGRCQGVPVSVGEGRCAATASSRSERWCRQYGIGKVNP